MSQWTRQESILWKRARLHPKKCFLQRSNNQPTHLKDKPMIYLAPLTTLSSRSRGPELPQPIASPPTISFSNNSIRAKFIASKSDRLAVANDVSLRSFESLTRFLKLMTMRVPKGPTASPCKKQRLQNEHWPYTSIVCAPSQNCVSLLYPYQYWHMPCGSTETNLCIKCDISCFSPDFAHLCCPSKE